MKVRLDERAKADIEDIRAYIAQHGSLEFANRVRDHLKTRIALLRRMPLLGRLAARSEIRILAPARYPYRIYYTIQSDTVVILHIRHTSRDAPRGLP